MSSPQPAERPGRFPCKAKPLEGLEEFEGHNVSAAANDDPVYPWKRLMAALRGSCNAPGAVTGGYAPKAVLTECSELLSSRQ